MGTMSQPGSSSRQLPLPAIKSTRQLGCLATLGPNVADFTGKEQDAETGLDYFGARYLSSAQGRWTSPDWAAKPQPVPYADFKDPQRLNLYAYVRNNPLGLADLDGHAQHCFLGICVGNADPPPPPSPLRPPTIKEQWATASGKTVTIVTKSVNYATTSGTMTTETRTGNHPFRDNNSGDVNSGAFANSHGAIGTDKGFAIFPDAKTGTAATDSLLQTPKYQGKTLDDAIAAFAPPCCNDTASYQATARDALGASGDTRLSALSGAQRSQLSGTVIPNVEGANVQGTTTTQTVPISPPF